MNKVILMGRLVKDPEVRYTQSSEPLAIARYTLAVKRNYRTQNQPEADFLNCVAFGKIAEFAEKHLKKGLLISVVGRIQVRNYTDNNSNQKFITEIIVDEHHFTGDKTANNNEFKNESETKPYSSPIPGFKPDYKNEFGWED